MGKLFGLFKAKEKEKEEEEGIATLEPQHHFYDGKWASIKDNHSFSNKTTKELIEEIHNSFNTEVDFLLNEAKDFKDLEELPRIDKRVAEKGNALNNLGFTATKTAIESKKEQRNLNAAKERNNKKMAEKKELVDAINYFSAKYPLYKFITEESVQKICSKYGLIYGSVEYYIGDVPNKNIKEMQNFKIEEQDEAYKVTFMATYEEWGLARGFIDKTFQHFCGNESKLSKDECRRIASRSYSDESSLKWLYDITHNKAPFEIAAPKKDFNLEGMETDGYEIVHSPQKIDIPDPVVLQPVWHKDKKYYLVVTAWGDEAEDELIMNENFN